MCAGLRPDGHLRAVLIKFYIFVSWCLIVMWEDPATWGIKMSEWLLTPQSLLSSPCLFHWSILLLSLSHGPRVLDLSCSVRATVTQRQLAAYWVIGCGLWFYSFLQTCVWHWFTYFCLDFCDSNNTQWWHLLGSILRTQIMLQTVA